MENNHIEKSTVAFDHCIGCGMCEAVCPYDAIDMHYNTLKEVEPKINHDNCADKCTACVKFCPFTQDKITSEVEKVINLTDPRAHGLVGGDYYISFDKRPDKRIKSASGGVVTELAASLLERKVIDLVIHAKMVVNAVGKEHYVASISESVEELETKRSSFYAAMSFGEVVESLARKEHHVLLIGVPCVVRAVKNMMEKNKLYKGIRLYSIALACSHIVNGEFVDFLAQSEGIVKGKKFFVNLRDKEGKNKEGIPDANNFNNLFYDASDDEGYEPSVVYVSKNRFKTMFTDLWRNYFFAKNICFKCSDFWGYTADVSVKDAWGKWSDDPMGKSIVVFRSHELRDLFLDNSNLEKETLTYDEVLTCQTVTTEFKHVAIEDRLNKPLFHTKNIFSGYTAKFLISRTSKFISRKFDFKKSFLIISLMVSIISFVNKLKPAIKRIRNILVPHIKLLLFNLRKFTKVFVYKKKYRYKNILVAGGYGYSNTGDEAQVNANLKKLKAEFPGYLITVLTHDRAVTHFEHERCLVFESPREAFYDHNGISTYEVSGPINKIIFLWISCWTFLNTYLVRAELPTLFLNAKKAALLEELRKSDLLFYSGGGYLTGKTLSRFWDAMFFIAMANVMRVPVVLSGQTIGVWNSSLNERIAKWGLSKTSFIATRDPDDSIVALKGIGLSSDRFIVTCDDALNSSVCNKSEVLKFLVESGMSVCAGESSEVGEYVALNIHYWGMHEVHQRVELLERVHLVVDCLLAQGNRILLIPMVPSDNDTIRDYMAMHPSRDVFNLKYDFDFKVIRGVISSAKMCITMKHHPIIFSIGERVPVISLAYGDYYEHKNSGALKLFGLGRCSLSFDDRFDIEAFEALYKQLTVQKEKFLNDVESNLEKIDQNEKIFWGKIRKLISD